jgi:hypothetical protein
VFALLHFRFISKVCGGKRRSLELQAYTFQLSKIGYIICKACAELKVLAESHFQNIFIFSIDNKVLHNDYQPMAQYLFVLSNFKLPES